MSKSRIVVASVAIVTSAALVLGATSSARADSLKSQTLSITEYPSSKGTYVGNSSALDVTGGSSGNPVTLAVASGSDGVCSAAFTDNSHVAIDYTGAGTCTIAFDQAGNAEYAAAAQQQYSLVIHKKPASATFFIGSEASTGQPAFLGGFLNGSNNAPLVGQKVTFTDVTDVTDVADAPTVAAAPGSFLCEATVGDNGFFGCDATFTTSGQHTVRGSFDGGATYESRSTEQTVTVSDPPMITTTSLPDATAGVPYSFQLQATGNGQLSFYPNSEISSWLTLDEDGTLHGTPTEAGDTDVNVDVYDSVGGRTEAHFTLTTSHAGKRVPTVAVSYNGSALVATVAGPTGAAAPTGTVRFEVDGKNRGSAGVKNGVFTKPYVIPAGLHHVKAYYSGDDNYTAAESAQLDRDDPTITAAVDPAASVHGWYRTAVSFTFTCTTTTADLTAPCPGKAVLRGEGANQRMSRTITAKDGGRANTTTAPVNIDLTAPSVQATGVSAGTTYTAQTLPSDADAFAATDALSGIDTLVVKHSVGSNTVTYAALATDKAGNTRKLVVTAKYRGPKPVTTTR